MAYSTIDDPTLHFNTKLYTGTGSELAITGVGFQPDFTWIKERNGSTNHMLTDSVRGATKTLHAHNIDSESTDAQALKSFDSDGFTVGTSSGANTNANNFVSWNWKAGTSFSNDASSTGVGSIDSAGSVSTDAGFSIMSYTGTGSTGTVAHGLGVKPSFLIYKNRATTDSWNVQHDGLTSYDYYVRFNSLGAQNNDIDVGPTAPTSSVVTVGSHAQQNGDGNAMILYAFAEKKGYSKFSSYTGNGNADGTFVYTGFKPAWILIKKTASNRWRIVDNKRPGYNTAINALFVELTQAETTASGDEIDLLSNGFKLRGTSGNQNDSGGTYIYMAFAENPFVTSTGVPATAR